MKTDRFNKLKELAQLREMTASAQLEAARRSLQEEKTALMSARKHHERLKLDGKKEVKIFMKTITSRNGYSSALTKLRAINAKVKHNVEEAENYIDLKVQSVANAVLHLQSCKDDYKAAHQKLEKLKILAGKISSEEEQMRQLSQEADTVDNYKNNEKRF